MEEHKGSQGAFPQVNLEEPKYNIEVGQPVFYWAPPASPGPVKQRWQKLRLWWWQKRGTPGWVPLGATIPLDEEDYPR